MVPDTLNIYALVIVLAGWIFTLCFHEFSHALVAYTGGDKSVKKKGYLTFNPVRYMHPFLSLVLPVLFLLIGGIGLPGGAVYIDVSRLRSRIWHCAAVLAGPLSNVILLGILMVPFWLGVANPSENKILWSAYAFLCFLQVMVTFLNLLPIPPLDGFGAISAFMPANLRTHLHPILMYVFYFALIIALIYVPVTRDIFWETVLMCSAKIGIPTELVYDGLNMIRLNLSI